VAAAAPSLLRAHLSSSATGVASCDGSAPPCNSTSIDSIDARCYGSRSVWSEGLEWEVLSFNPLLTTAIASHVHDPMFDNWESITWPRLIATRGTIVPLISAIRRKYPTHTQPPVPGARACGRYLSQADRTRCSHEGVSTAIPTAVRTWLLQQLQLLLLLESNSSPHIVCFATFVIATLNCQRQLVDN
jgi:hypothetical protein